MHTLDAHSGPVKTVVVVRQARIVTGSWDRTAKVSMGPNWSVGLVVISTCNHIHPNPVIWLFLLQGLECEWWHPSAYFDRPHEAYWCRGCHSWRTYCDGIIGHNRQDIRRARYGLQWNTLTNYMLNTTNHMHTCTRTRICKCIHTTPHHARSGKCRRTLKGHTGGIQALALTQDNEIITGSLDSSAKIWDRQTGACLRTLTGHTASVRGLAGAVQSVVNFPFISLTLHFEIAGQWQKEIVW